MNSPAERAAWLSSAYNSSRWIS
uniref:F5/8 type C domain-containing protein n=1 Tax=Nymphaea colorata TaxID=210225 RepID=A0A5K1F8A3_9MAGN|nr:unnamed protein product [Nymphaea colorata]